MNNTAELRAAIAAYTEKPDDLRTVSRVYTLLQDEALRELLRFPMGPRPAFHDEPVPVRDVAHRAVAELLTPRRNTGLPELAQIGALLHARDARTDDASESELQSILCNKLWHAIADFHAESDPAYSRILRGRSRVPGTSISTSSIPVLGRRRTRPVPGSASSG